MPVAYKWGGDLRQGHRGQVNHARPGPDGGEDEAACQAVVQAKGRGTQFGSSLCQEGREIGGQCQARALRNGRPAPYHLGAGGH